MNPLFISEPQRLIQLSSQSTIILSDFSIAHYKNTLFAQFGIQYPIQLTRAVNKRKAEFLAGRYCAKYLLENQFNCSGHVPIGEHRYPIWPSNIAGSISHCDHMAIATATHKNIIGSVGIDIEKCIQEKDISAVQNEVINKDELQIFSQLTDVFPEGLTLLFSAKESFFKAAYAQVGYYFGFDALSLMDFEIHTQYITLQLHLNKDLSNHYTQGMHFFCKGIIFKDEYIITLVEY